MPFFLATGQNTVCRFRDFSVIQILREINFEACREWKICHLKVQIIVHSL